MINAPQGLVSILGFLFS